jgi:hypothetical protein
MVYLETGREGMNWIHVDQNRYKKWALVNSVIRALGFIKCKDQLKNSFLLTNSVPYNE